MKHLNNDPKLVKCADCKDLIEDVYYNDSCDSLCEFCHIDQVNEGLTSDKYGILEEFPS
tara:strand:+ start:8 stop:184 length:177 start_codon:yes stop_codon:yes gene_type:complete